MSDLPFNPETLLSQAECLAVDQTLLPYRDKFTIRLAMYALRTLQPLADQLGRSVTTLSDAEILAWVAQQPTIQAESSEFGDFAGWYAKILAAARVPLAKAAAAKQVTPESLTVTDIIAWFESQIQGASS
jgi:hypothetical protein